MRECSLVACESKHYSRGWCHKHYARWRKTGDPMGTRTAAYDETLAERLGRYTQFGGDCWLWVGCITSGGYGAMRYRGRMYPAHRLWYEEVVGPIPDGFQIDHLCRVRHCVNPDHLEAVSPRENLLRKSHCPTCQCVGADQAIGRAQA